MNDRPEGWHPRQKYRDLTERLIANTIPVLREPELGLGECWEWFGTLDEDGYARVSLRIDGRHVKARAHRVAYEELRGEKLEEGMTLEHKCRNKRCINPDHMEPLSRVENSKRMRAFWRHYFTTGEKRF